MSAPDQPQPPTPDTDPPDGDPTDPVTGPAGNATGVEQAAENEERDPVG